MDKNLQISMLLDIYGKLLTSKQYDAIDFYYNKNFSLSEIAEETGITRQGVRKNISDAEKKLFEYDSKLGLLEQNIQRVKLVRELIEETEDVNFKEKLEKLL